MRIFFALSTFLFLCSINLFGLPKAQVPKEFQSNLLVYEPIFDNPDLIPQHAKDELPGIKSALLKGDSLFLNGESAKACEWYKKGFQLSRKCNVKWYQVIFLNRLGFVNYWIASISKSYEYYSEALRIISTEEQKTDSLAILETAFFCDLLNPLNAVIDEPKLFKLLNSINSDSYQSSRLIKYYYLLLEINRQAGKFTEVLYALSDMKKAIDQCNKTNKNFWLYIKRIEETYYYKRRNISEIATNFEVELVNQVNTQPQFKELAYAAKYSLAESCYKTEQYQKAIDLLKELQPIVEKDKDPFFFNYYLWLGYYYFMSGDSVQPDLNYIKAEKLLEDNNIKDNRLARVYIFRASFNPKLDESSEASLNYLLNALDILKYSPFDFLERHAYYSIGDHYYNNRQFLQAAAYYSHLLMDIDSLLDDELYFKQQLPKLLIKRIPEILRWRATSYFLYSKRHNFDINSLSKSDEDFNKLNLLWAKLFDYLENYEDFKISILKSIRDSYNSSIDVGFAHYAVTKKSFWLDKMFDLSQGSKVILLNSYLNDRIAQRIAGIPEDSIQKSLRIKKELDVLQYSKFQSFSGSDSKTGNDFLISTIIDKYQEYDRYVAQLEKEYPDYALQKKKDIKISRREIQKKLDNDQALIEYYTAFDGFFTFYIDKKTFKVIYYKIPDNIYETSDKCKRYYELLSQMSEGQSSDDRRKELYALSNWLYQLLITPIKDDIKGKRLIIVPDLELNMIPFETLISRLPSEKDLLKNAIPSYLILTNPISYLYSSSQLGKTGSSTVKNARYAGFAPDYTNEKNSRPINYYQGIDKLPGALEEVNAANGYFRGKLFSKEKATKENFFSALARFDIIHLAMHTSIDENEPMNSELIFSLDSLNQEDQLHAYEVYALENNTKMAVLSACNTAKGKLESGEGVFNIARAFFLAGIPNVIVTQWSVADMSSASLMNGFYNYLSEGIPSDVAMQKGKIDILLKGDPVRKDPYYWSGYICYGTSIFVPSMKYLKVIYYTSAVLLMLALTIFLYKRKAKN